MSEGDRNRFRLTKCPACAGVMRVVDAKRLPDGEKRRVFRCLPCKREYTTVESSLTPTFLVAKKNGTLQLFLPDKLAASIEMSAYNHELPRGWARQVAHEVARAGIGEESSQGLAMRAAKVLAARDPMLALRYLIVCLDTKFEDLATVYRWVHEWTTEGRV